MLRLPDLATVVAMSGAGVVLTPGSLLASPIFQESAPRSTPAEDPARAAAAPGKVDVLKRSIAPGRIFVLGSEEFVSDETLNRVSYGNGILVLNTACYMAAGDLASVRPRQRDPAAGWKDSLSDDTKRVLRGLENDVQLTVYLSHDLPFLFKEAAADLRAALVEFSASSRDRLKTRFVEVDGDERAIEEARTAGIESQYLCSRAGNDDRDVFLGVAFEQGGRREALPYVSTVETLEYDLIRRIEKVARRERVRIAWQATGATARSDRSDARAPSAGARHSPSTDLLKMDELLKREYETTTVDLESRVPDDVKVLVLCNCEAMTDVQKFWADQFLMRGGAWIVLADGSQARSSSGIPGGNQKKLMRSCNDKLPEVFFSNYGFTINWDVVLDQQCAGIRWQGQFLRYPAFVASTVKEIDQDHPISATVTILTFMFASSIGLSPKPGVTAFELVRSSDHAKHLGPLQLQSDWSENSEATLKGYDSRFVLAALLEGEFDSFYASHPVPKEALEPAAPGRPDGGR